MQLEVQIHEIVFYATWSTCALSVVHDAS